MDTTETYIKMCEKADAEIQGRVPQEGDYFSLCTNIKCTTYRKESHKKDTGVILICGHYEANIHHGDIWLPRQDQLQEIAKDMAVSERKLAVYFGRWCEDWGDFQFSLEKLWLAFVMKEKYNKIWNGEGWVVES